MVLQLLARLSTAVAYRRRPSIYAQTREARDGGDGQSRTWTLLRSYLGPRKPMSGGCAGSRACGCESGWPVKREDPPRARAHYVWLVMYRDEVSRDRRPLGVRGAPSRLRICLRRTPLAARSSSG